PALGIEGDALELGAVGCMLLARAPRGLAVEELLYAPVAMVVKQGAPGVGAVAPGASGLLVVRLQAARHLGMHDEADVRLVDAHAEGVGGHHDARIAAHEALLTLGALARG